MSEIWVGISVVGNEVNIVGLNFMEDDEITKTDDFTWGLQAGDRPAAYSVMSERVRDYLSSSKAQRIVVKGSSVPFRGKVTLAHLESAELRGVIIAAAAKSGISVTIVSKAVVSRNFGQRKADEYLTDDSFWNEVLSESSLRKGSRDTALHILAVRKFNEK